MSSQNEASVAVLKARKQARIDALAEHMANGGTLSSAAQEIGITYDRIKRLWSEIRKSLGE